MRKCKKCGKECYEDEHEGEEHHIIPTGRGWLGEDKDGRIILCKKHHDMIAKFLLDFVGKEIKKNSPELWNKIRGKFKGYTDWWLNANL